MGKNPTLIENLVNTDKNSCENEVTISSKVDQENPYFLLQYYKTTRYSLMSQFFEGILSKYQCGFRKGHSAQHALISLLEKWRYNVDQGRMFGALLTDLS